MSEINEGITTKFHGYICFTTESFDTTPEAENDDGVIDVPVISLDGDFTVEELELIISKFKEKTK